MLLIASVCESSCLRLAQIPLLLSLGRESINVRKIVDNAYAAELSDTINANTPRRSVRYVENKICKAKKENKEWGTNNYFPKGRYHINMLQSTTDVSL